MALGVGSEDETGDDVIKKVEAVLQDLGIEAVAGTEITNPRFTSRTPRKAPKKGGVLAGTTAANIPKV